jgi:fucose permease
VALEVNNLSMEKVVDKSKGELYREYGYRYAIVAIFCLLSFVDGMCWVVVSPISVPVGRAYGQSNLVVSFIPMCYMIIYVLINFPSNWVLDVRGIKKGIVVGAVLTAIGTAFRCLITTHFAFIIVGQILCAIGQPFILNAPTKIAVRWFLPESVFRS